MDKGLVLEIVSPDGQLFKDTVVQVTLPAAHGELTLLPGHAPLFTSLAAGEVLLTKGGEITSITVTGGFIEVSEDRVTILANYAIRSDEIVAKEAEDAKRKAAEALKMKQDRVAKMSAEKDLMRSTLELKVAAKYKKRPKKHV
jgi:F-type H+-transporting ATPase subunit epsilon